MNMEDPPVNRGDYPENGCLEAGCGPIGIVVIIAIAVMVLMGGAGA